jgi:hypothetical protein
LYFVIDYCRFRGTDFESMCVSTGGRVSFLLIFLSQNIYCNGCSVNYGSCVGDEQKANNFYFQIKIDYSSRLSKNYLKILNWIVSYSIKNYSHKLYTLNYFKILIYYTTNQTVSLSCFVKTSFQKFFFPFYILNITKYC